MRLSTGLIGLGVAFAALPVGMASAGTVGVVGADLIITGTPGIDEIDIFRSGSPQFVNGGPTYTVSDRRNPLTPGARCAQGDSP